MSSNLMHTIPLNAIEKSELFMAASKVLTDKGLLLLRRLMFQADMELERSESIKDYKSKHGDKLTMSHYGYIYGAYRKGDSARLAVGTISYQNGPDPLIKFLVESYNQCAST